MISTLAHSFHLIFMILYIQWIWIFQKIRTICTSKLHYFPLDFQDFLLSTNNNFFFFYKSERSVYLVYLIFHWIFMIFYIQRNQISQQVWTIYTSNVHNFPLNFQDLVRSSILNWIFMILYIQRIQIFKQI